MSTEFEKAAQQKIIVALDGMNEELALQMAEKLKDLVWGFKVNSLLRARGYDLIKRLAPYGGVFADLKLHDIPETIINDLKFLLEMDKGFISVMASGGVSMMERAVFLMGQKKILAITVLTSLDEENCQLIYGCSCKAAVLKFSRMAILAGVPGVVASAQDLSIFPANPEISGLLRITPGIRLAGGDPGDQRRVDSPRGAIEAGADWLVIGRPITKPMLGTSETALNRIVDEVKLALLLKAGRDEVKEGGKK